MLYTERRQASTHTLVYVYICQTYWILYMYICICIYKHCICIFVYVYSNNCIYVYKNILNIVYVYFAVYLQAKDRIGKFHNTFFFMYTYADEFFINVTGYVRRGGQKKYSRYVQYSYPYMCRYIYIHKYTHTHTYMFIHICNCAYLPKTILKICSRRQMYVLLYTLICNMYILLYT